ncbi:16S rRNA (uracil(1498)-N(3))-methyltransferase [Halobacillus shinanisalinarum]|uniref:Ribosomal RNA small subunit methyltransferase E n=1 Tax=Halobacillus shinanisalinarum TaxID=2932258 RepID=A0ABY4H1J8_9BACI|nr:16S rRNA (uracil(1498)-N(3))-methyltransferase [Halobacillus shinanisalinarum]UOQ93785.1 16S rRNA (uracil(1498)-N(3))-methyltransferase [Halobacillus shinanisalinarum]
MQRYFIDQANWEEDRVVIKGDDVHHIVKVMRMKKEDSLICVHPERGPALCEIVAAEQEVLCSIIDWLDENKELPVEVTIVQSLGKGDKLEQVVQKGTELGADFFIPFDAERSVAKWDAKKANKKLTRLKKIAKEASEQSERAKVPSVLDVMTLSEIIEQNDSYDVKLIAHENEARSVRSHSLSSRLHVIKDNQRVIIIFGPEGGFTPGEADKLFASGFLPVRLGPRILRMETAPLYFLSSLSYQLEEQ